MIDPISDDFVEDNPTAAPMRSSGDSWQKTKDKVGDARQRTEVFLRRNPIPTIVGALTIGLAIGWALRHATIREEKEIEVESPLGRINWSFLSLPFLLPLLKSVREKYDDATDAMKTGVDRLRKIDIERYTKPVRKRWKAWTH